MRESVLGESGFLPPAESEAVAVDRAADEIPTRYEIREREDGRVLVCREAPGLAVWIDRSYRFTEAEARRLSDRAILLDGAGSFGPLVDPDSHLYNLDHHEGAVRTFTLATCEQALMLVAKGLDLASGDWSLYANEPDLDTVFAIWTLLNYRRVRSLDAAGRDRIVPLLRLEGAIDANGFEAESWCGLPSDRLEMERARLDGLHRLELETKRTGEWQSGDLLAYTRDMLVELDHLVYRGGDFVEVEGVEIEYGHVDIGQGKVAVVCRDGGGIYDVERRLKTVWADRLGLIALERQPGEYTLRRTAALSGIALEAAYDRLNLLDPAVDGRPATKRWGGSDEIGGSPRPGGTELSPREIGKILKLTYRAPSAASRARKALSAAGWAAALVALAAVSVFLNRLLGGAGTLPGGVRDYATGAGALAVASAVAIRRLSRGWTWIYGWRLPAGRSWLMGTLGVAALGAAGALPVPLVGLPSTDGSAPGWMIGWTLAAVVVMAAALELCFRGVVHGQLVIESKLSGPGDRLFVSRPAALAALLFAATVCTAHFVWLEPPRWLAAGLVAIGGSVGLGSESWASSVTLGATTALLALLAGVGLGLLRERSLSLWPGALGLALGGWLRGLLDATFG